MNSLTVTTFEPTREELMAVFAAKYGRRPRLGWGPQLRLSFDYFTPDDHYEALVGKLLPEGAEWCDVGCGRNIFPTNPELAEAYACRCRFVFGIDPDDNIRENTFVHQYFQGMVEHCPLDRRFDLITLRMVAEHVVNPGAVLQRLAAMLKPLGAILIYTPHKWAPMSIVANLTPFALHNPLKRILWNTEARDTFPTAYRMNTRAALEAHAAKAGLKQTHYQCLDDCRISNSYRTLNWLELQARRGMRSVGLRYPESCIISVLQLAHA